MKPITITNAHVAKIPEVLRKKPQWVVWKMEKRDGKPTKVLYQSCAPELKAKSNDQTTWSSFEEALDCYRQSKDTFSFAGVGYVFDHDYTGIDLDNALDDERRLKPWAKKILAHCQTYAEISARGRGVHAIAKGPLPDGYSGCNQKYKDGKVEIYSAGRYFTVTGRRLKSASPDIRDCSAVIRELYQHVTAGNGANNNKGSKSNASNEDTAFVGNTLSDAELLERAHRAKNGAKFWLLWHGDITGYASHSEADQALSNLLAFWTNKDPERMDRLFRQSGLYRRDKWEREDYRERTIQNAIEHTEEGYSDDLPIPIEERWPSPLRDAAFYGVTGDIVRVVSPHTEADDAALLITTLVMFGSMVGRSAFYLVGGATMHFANLYCCLVGKTSKARKGEAERQIEAVFKQVSEEFVLTNIKSGAASGEGLIFQVRDAVVEHRKNKGHVVVDKGVEDKRLCDFEGEFAHILKVACRPGNTLSTALRDLWDSRDAVGNLSKHSSLKATGPHVSIIAHSTKEDLLQHLNSTEIANGFANRFLWVCVKRSKKLPEGGSFDPTDIEAIADRLTDVVQFAQTVSRVDFDDDARKLWHKIYDDLSAEHLGLFGAITARAEPIVLRLALIYALLDKSESIKVEHLHAAIAVWSYAEESAKFIFGSSTGDPWADEILAVLRQTPEGMTRTDIVDLFSRNKNVGSSLFTLLGSHLVERRTKKTKGRPVERWFAI